MISYVYAFLFLQLKKKTYALYYIIFRILGIDALKCFEYFMIRIYTLLKTWNYNKIFIWIFSSVFELKLQWKWKVLLVKSYIVINTLTFVEILSVGKENIL